MKSPVLAIAALLLSASAVAALERQLPFHTQGLLRGWEAHDEVFSGHAGQTVHIKTQSKRPNWLVVLLTPVSGEGAALFSSDSAGDLSGDVTLPRDGAYRLRAIIRRPEARRGGEVDFSIDVTE